MLERMIKADMVMPIDHAKIPNMANIDKPFQDAAFDPGPQVLDSLYVGNARRRLPQVEGRRRGRQLEAPARQRSACRQDLPPGRCPERASAAALKYLGYSFNSTDLDELKKVEELLIKQKKNVKVFADDNGQDLLASGEVDVCMEWNGDIMQVMAEDEDLAYAVPTEGSLLWQDYDGDPQGRAASRERPHVPELRP